MRVVVLGGTRFIGRAAVEHLASSGHDVIVVHRGETEPADFVDVRHVHVDRRNRADLTEALRGLDGDAVLDAFAMSRADAETAAAALPPGMHVVVLSSMDVYRAFGALLKNIETDRVPIDERSPVREARYPYRGQLPGRDDYDKLDVESVYLARKATVLRLPMVHGEHDPQRREEFILRRVRARRGRIPFGAGTWLTCRGYVGEIARAIGLALARPELASETFNLAEQHTASVRLWARAILEAAGWEAELVRVEDALLPPDLSLTGSVSQHLLADASRARELLAWVHTDPTEGLRRSVAWHLAHPPGDAEAGFEADDRALASVQSSA